MAIFPGCTEEILVIGWGNEVRVFLPLAPVLFLLPTELFLLTSEALDFFVGMILACFNFMQLCFLHCDLAFQFCKLVRQGARRNKPRLYARCDIYNVYELEYLETAVGTPASLVLILSV